MIVEILRLDTSQESGTFGSLLIDKRLFCVTLEPPDNMNKAYISSIPTGQYVCAPYSSAKYPNVYQIMDVPDRDNILFHIGNFKSDTKGCVMLGRSVGEVKGNRAILMSADTFNRFREIVGEQNFHLTVSECYQRRHDK